MRRLLLAVAVLTGCGDDGGGPLTANDLPGAVVNALCSAYVRCGLLSDAQICRTLDLDEDIDPELIAAVNNGSVHYDAVEAQQCVAGFGASCEEDRLFDSNAHCDEVFSGTVEAGGACAIDEQCISQNCTVPSCPDACCHGTCDPGDAPVRAGIGDSCAQTFRCSEGFCDETTTICTALRGLGETCNGSNECAQGHCTGTCVAYPGEGDPCQPDSSCNSIGLYCNGTTCVAFALEGDHCDDMIECSPAYTCTGGTCVLKPTLGDACGVQNECIDKSYCDTTTMKCTAPKPDGAACSPNGPNECAGECDFSTNQCMSEPICI